MTDLPDMRQCPFCGGNDLAVATRKLRNGAFTARIACLDCDADGPPTDVEHEHEAAATAAVAWNRRTFSWRPIDSAPKNKIVLLTNGLETWAGLWMDAYQRFMPFTEAGLGFRIQPSISHWMPLPKPPKVDKK